MKTTLLSFFIVLITLSSLNAQLLKTLKTDDLNLIYYSAAHRYIVPHLARCHENTLGFYKKFFNYTPTEEVTIFLQDFSDWGNGGATAVPNNFVTIYIAPFPYAYETVPVNERMTWLMNHELTHVLAMDKASDTDDLFRTIFRGKVVPTTDNPMSMIYAYLTSPRKYSPRWYHEGIAVFMETWMAGGLGRIFSSYYEMVFRTMVRDQAAFYDVVGLESEGAAIDFQVGANSYLYGTRFFTYLANKFGPEKLIDWTSRTNGSKRNFAGQFKKVFGVPLKQEWSQWIEFEHEWQLANLDSIRKYPVTPHRSVVNKPLGSVSRACYDSERQKLYVAIRYPGQMAHIAAIDINSGKTERLCDIKGAALYYVCSLAYNPGTGKIFFTTDNGHFRDLNVVDVKTHKTKMLIKDFRAGSLAFNRADKSLWGVRHENGISTLIKMEPPYKDWTAILAYPYGTDIYNIDISPDGTTLTAAMTHVNGQQKLVSMNIERLLQSDSSYDVLFDFDISSPANFVFSPDGKFLYGSSYYTGVSNIFRYDFEKNDMEVLSNTETGFFRPVPVSRDSLIVFRYTCQGFLPVWIPDTPVEHVSAIRFLGQEIVNNFPIVKTWRPGSPASISLDSLTTYKGNYSSWKNIRLSSAYPIVEGYKDYGALGYRLDFRNEVGFNGFDISASYTPNENLPENERYHVRINYHYWLWKVSARVNDANFYDLFGPTKVSRKGYALQLEYDKTYIYDKPRFLELHCKLAGYGGLEKLPDYQNINAQFDRFMTVAVGLKYDFVEESLGAVDDEKGIRVHLNTNTTYVNEKLYPRFYSNLDYGFLLPINHSSIWLRSSLGYSFGDSDDPFANFYFGGFGNNWLDYLNEKRYREYYSFPGTELNSIGGTNYAKLLFEWTLPPLRFRHFGVPNLYFRWARLALFSSGIITNFDSRQYRSSFINFGSQLDFRLVSFSLFKSTFSFGYAISIDESRNLSKEFMFSLKIL